MKKNYLIILVILLIIALSVYFIYYYQSNNKVAEEDIPIGTNLGQKAPDFTLEQLNGQELRLSDLRGKKVFLNFWASWCPPCNAEMPAIQQLFSNHQQVAILAVNIQEERGTVSEYMLLNAYSFPVVLDKTGEVANTYLVRGIPTTYIIDEKGLIMGKHTGALTYQQMLELLKIE